MRDDILEIEILPDGRIKTTIAGEVSAANHSSAERFLRELQKLTGGERETEKLKKTHSHHHNHEHQKRSH